MMIRTLSFIKLDFCETGPFGAHLDVMRYDMIRRGMARCHVILDAISSDKMSGMTVTIGWL
jgi:hypothetical protein